MILCHFLELLRVCGAVAVGNAGKLYIKARRKVWKSGRASATTSGERQGDKGNGKEERAESIRHRWAGRGSARNFKDAGRESKKKILYLLVGENI